MVIAGEILHAPDELVARVLSDAMRVGKRRESERCGSLSQALVLLEIQFGLS
jgi:hypothetical protein